MQQLSRRGLQGYGAAGARAADPLRHSTRVRPCAAAVEVSDATPSSSGSIGHSASGIDAAKAALRHAIAQTGRGLRAGTFKRAEVEEAQVAVEGFGAGQDLPYDKLPGLWRLDYTTANDVIPILDAESRLKPPIGPSPIQVGDIYQRFSDVGSGVVENVIRLSVPFLLEERRGVTITVVASYEVRSPHHIAITFDEARVGQLQISNGLEAVLAPAILPRGSLQHRLLLAIKQFQLRFPFRSAQQVARSVEGAVSLGGQRPVASGYHLTYLDGDMLIGRATSLGGTFIFTRVPDDHASH